MNTDSTFWTSTTTWERQNPVGMEHYPPSLFKAKTYPLFLK